MIRISSGSARRRSIRQYRRATLPRRPAIYDATMPAEAASPVAVAISSAAPSLCRRVSHPRRVIASWLTSKLTQSCSGTVLHPLKKALRDDQDIARLKRDITCDVAVPDQVSQMHRIRGLDTVRRTDDQAVVPCCISGEAANC